MEMVTLIITILVNERVPRYGTLKETENFILIIFPTDFFRIMYMYLCVQISVNSCIYQVTSGS